MSRKNKSTTEKSDVCISGLRVPTPIITVLKAHAASQERTLVAQIRVALREWTAQHPVAGVGSQQFPQKNVQPPVTIPPALAPYVGPQDMTGLGSIPHDDELLPDAEGDPLVPD